MKPADLGQLNTVCEVCGDIGYKRLLLCCRDCKCSAAHQYCLDKVVFDASLAEWSCYECLQRRGEVTCNRSLGKASSERPPSHAQLGSTVHQPVAKRVESTRDAGPWRNSVKDGGANLSTKHIDHDNQTNQHASVGSKNTEVKPLKDTTTVVGAHQTSYWAEASLRNSKDKSEAHCDSKSNVIYGLMLKREMEEDRFQLDYRDSNELPQRNIAADVPQPSVLQNDALHKVMPYSPNDGCEKVLSCAGIKNIPSVRERNVDSIDISSSPHHDNTESSESSERFVECQKGSSCRKTVKMVAASSSSVESGEDIPSENESLESDDLQAPPGADYVLSRTSYLSDEQKERVIVFIQETKPEITAFVAVMRKSNVQPLGPCLGISKEYAFAHFPHKSTNVTLQRPGKSKKWHPIFYKRNESRKNMLMGKWLNFVRDNHVQEGDICLLVPTKSGRRSTFTVYLLHETATHSRGGADSQRVGPCPGGSIAKMASEDHIKEELTNEEHVSSKSGMHKISHEFLESENSVGASQPLYIVPCKSRLSKSQQKIVEERVRAI